MTDVLRRICDTKRAEVAARKARRPLAEVVAAARDQDPPAASPQPCRAASPPEHTV